MKDIILISLALTLVSCGARRPGKIGAAGIDGASGTDGSNGSNGNDGLSLVVDVQTQVSLSGVVCKRTDIFQDTDRNNYYSAGDNYQNGFLVCDGAIGSAGQNGLNGLDGTNGVDGLDADQTYQIVEIYDPCGQQHPSGFDEVILKLGDGRYLASFSDNANGLNTRFGVLKPGSYVTTDGTGCNFTIN